MKSSFEIESDDDPHVLIRLVGTVARRGGRIERLSCEPLLGERQQFRISVIGIRPELMLSQLRKIDGLERVVLCPTERMPVENRESE